jgi:hypothetical protein
MKQLIFLGFCTGLLGFAALGAVSCGGSSETTKTSNPVAKKDFSTKFAVAFCEGIKNCCQASGITSNTTDCETVLTAQLNAAFARYEGKKVTLNDTAAGHCIDAYRTAVTACTDPVAADQVETVCRGVFVGTVAPGGDCSISDECKKDGAQSVNCDAGICTVDNDRDYWNEAHAKLGEACSGTCEGSPNGDMSCTAAPSNANSNASAMCWVNDGLVCSANGTCAAVPSLGQACSGSSRCGSDAYCSGSVCVARIETGSCESNSEACASSSFCDYDTYQCTPKKTNGSTCNSDDECVNGDCSEDRCRTWSMANASSCSGLLDD